MSDSDFQSWGRFPVASQEVCHVNWMHDATLPKNGQSLLPYGQGRSYGDCCLNDGGVIIDTSGLDRFISLDEVKGLLRCESGVTLEAILDLCVPRGWFLPVSPGTKYVSVGGAIANDIHGKNHHRCGTFGCHVTQFELLRSDGERVLCSPDENGELYRATIAGLGLTGLILWVEIQMKKVEGPFIDFESIKFGSIDEFFEISSASEQEFEYTVAWLDCLARGESLGRGIFMRGNHSAQKGETPRKRFDGLLSVPFDFPGFALNKYSVQAFNTLYYQRQRRKEVKKVVPYDPFFYPLDGVRHWNRIYGKRGFLQFQCVVPVEESREPVRNMLRMVAESGRASFLVVFKEFGDIPSPGMLSFPRPGATLCLDFPHEGGKTIDLMRKLESMTMEAGGALYPSKDACMLPESYQKSYPEWKRFSEYIDAGFSSSFWRRVTGGGDT